MTLTPPADTIGSIVVLAVGNTLCRDDGVGPQLLGRLQSDPPPTSLHIDYVDVGTTGLLALEYLRGAGGVLILDAMRTGCPPGTVQVLESNDMDAYLKRPTLPSAHDVSLADLIGAAAFAGVLPRYRALVGIEPHIVEWGTELSQPVANALPRACNAVHRLVQQWTVSWNSNRRPHHQLS